MPHITMDIGRCQSGRRDLPLDTELRYTVLMTKMTPIESEFASTDEAEAHDRWVRAKVETALASQASNIPHDQVMAEIGDIIDAKRGAATRLAR